MTGLEKTLMLAGLNEQRDSLLSEMNELNKKRNRGITNNCIENNYREMVVSLYKLDMLINEVKEIITE